MSVYLDDYTIEASVTAGWLDITSDAITAPLSAEWGITGNRAIDLFADAGGFSFTLNNIEDKYIPGHTSAVAGWDKNTPIRLTVTFESRAYVHRFYVNRLDVVSRGFNRKRIGVICADYIEYLARTPLISPTVQVDKRADEGLTTIIANIPIAPQATSYETGQETFPTILSAVTPNTKIYSEAVKLINSEFGYLYRIADRDGGETLVFEDRHYRNGWRALSTSQKYSDFLLLETGDYLLLETGDKLILNKLGAVIINNSTVSIEIEYGADVVNYFKSITHPTTVTAGASTLWTLGEPIEIGGKETVEFRTNYSDSTGGNTINCLTSDATGTTKSFRENRDGTGANLDADLAVTATFGSEGVLFSLKNNNQDTGYVTALTATGTGILSYNPFIQEENDSTSQSSYGYLPQGINQVYQKDPDLGILKGKSIVNAEKKPRLDLKKVSFSANRSGALMTAFLDIDVGDLVRILEADAEIDGFYYVQGKEFTIDLGGIVNYSWNVREQKSISDGNLTPIALEFGGTASGHVIDIGRIPYIEDDKTRSFAAWVYLEPFSGSANVIFSNSTGSLNAGVIFYSSFDKIAFITYNTVTTFGYWLTDAAVSTETWIHVGVTHDVSASSLAAPLIYVNGSSVAITENSTPVGAYTSENGTRFGIGNTGQGTGNTMDGKIADMRVYNTILSTANMTTLYNAGDPSSSVLTENGLVLQAPNVYTKDYADLLDGALAATDRVTDNMFGIVGTPIGGEIVRVFP